MLLLLGCQAVPPDMPAIPATVHNNNQVVVLIPSVLIINDAYCLFKYLANKELTREFLVLHNG